MMILLLHSHIAVWWAKDLWQIPFISAHGMVGVSLFFLYLRLHYCSRSLAQWLRTCKLYGQASMANRTNILDCY